MNAPQWTRRGLLRSGLAASALPLLADEALGEEKASTTPTSPAPAPPRTLFLFLDWFQVQKGELQTRLDLAHVPEEGRKLLEMYARDFDKHFPRGTHGFEEVNLPFGIKIVPEIARRSEPWLKPDQPWEKDLNYFTVLHDEGRYRCWYMATLQGKKPKLTFDEGRAMEIGGSALAYAESTDGWNWTRPKRNIVTIDGETNLLTPYGNGGLVFRDDHGPAEERYKSLHFDALPQDEVPPGAPSHDRYGLYGVFSPDGYHWTKKPKPLVRYFCDTDNVVAWDPLLRKYVGYFRHHISGRAISRSETDDFWNWPEPQPLLNTGPMDDPADDIYTNGYTTYPDDPALRLLFPSFYHRDNDSVDTRIAVSRCGRAFQWISHKPIIPLGPPGAWDSGASYAQINLLHLPDGKLALPYQASPVTHNEYFFKLLYGQYPGVTNFAWALWDDGRLAGIQADHIGQFVTNGARFDGTQIQINARTTRAGSVEVEVRERVHTDHLGQFAPNSKAVEGFSFADSVPFSGDETWATCRWKGKDDLSALRGKSLELAFRLRSAKVFGYRFV
jgi:hypothetical protein